MMNRFCILTILFTAILSGCQTNESLKNEGFKVVLDLDEGRDFYCEDNRAYFLKCKCNEDSPKYAECHKLYPRWIFYENGEREPK